MPHVGAASGGEDLASSDEIKVFKEEGDEEERSSENLTDLKSSLVTEGEEEKNSEPPGPDYGSPKNPDLYRPDSASHSGKSFELLSPHSTPIGYVVSPYPHPHNGTLGPVSMAGKVPMVPPHSGSPLPFMVYNGEPFAQPPPAHMGIPPVAIDPKTGIPRPPVYHLGPPGQYPPVFSPEFTHQLQWHTPALYPPTSAGFRSAYSAALPVTSASLPRFSPPALISPYPGISHPALITSGTKQELPLHHSNHRCILNIEPIEAGHKRGGKRRRADVHPLVLQLANRLNSQQSMWGISGDDESLPEYPNEPKYNAKPVTPVSHSNNNNSTNNSNINEKKVHIKKPLNAFMLYMKEMRAKVVAECTLKESAAINQILGRRWHSLSREEQAKYYEMARKERQLHMQLYPGWSARDNYALQVKKKKRKKDRSQDGDGNNLKKCRARFGLDQQSSWCKPCRRKKKCIRYLDSNDHGEPESEDNLGSTGSVEAPTPESPDTDHSLDIPANDHNLHHKPLSPPSPMESKPRLDTDGSIIPPSPRPPSRHQSHTLYHHHPLSVHHLIQPHFGRLTERFQQDSATPSHMLTVT